MNKSNIKSRNLDRIDELFNDSIKFLSESGYIHYQELDESKKELSEEEFIDEMQSIKAYFESIASNDENLFTEKEVNLMNKVIKEF